MRKGRGIERDVALKKAETALQEGQEQFRCDVLGIIKNRPKWAIEKELEQQGLFPVVTDKELEYLREVEEAQSGRGQRLRLGQNIMMIFLIKKRLRAGRNGRLMH